MSPLLRTGIVGVGQMGGRMALRIREAGDPIVAHDRDAERLAASGIDAAGSLEGGLTGRLMAKDIRLYLDHVARLGVPTFTGPACLATFEVANALGYEDQISNRVVDGIGDLAGGVRLHDPNTETGETA